MTQKITELDVSLRKSFFINRNGIDYVWWVYVDGEFKKEYTSDEIEFVKIYLIGLGKTKKEVNQMIDYCNKKNKELMK